MTRSIARAVAKIQKAFAPVTEVDGSFTALRDGYAIEFLRNGRGESFTCLRVRRVTDHDDSQSDYFAGMWCDSVKQAIDHALRNIARDAAERTAVRL